MLIRWIYLVMILKLYYSQKKDFTVKVNLKILNLD
nr:MAG TPA: hypothetical protein [Crassvirales sp.]